MASFQPAGAPDVPSVLYPLTTEFRGALKLVEIGTKSDRAIQAHQEIRELLESDPQLRAWGVDTVLIGSYRRRTGISPGKDVDVFVKLTELSTADVDPETVYNRVLTILMNAYGDRVEPQPRSVKVRFDGVVEFSVDAVPAVRYDTRWAIPARDREAWADPSQRWVETDPEKLTQLTELRNRTPTVDGRGAYIPMVKLVRQVRQHHLQKGKPGGFYFEVMTYWAFTADQAGETNAELLATTLSSVAGQLTAGDVADPVLGRPYLPAPDPVQLAAAATLFGKLASQAHNALQMDRCPAAATWRTILGENDSGSVFPIPDGCDAEGRVLPITGLSVSRGPREAGGFA